MEFRRISLDEGALRLMAPAHVRMLFLDEGFEKTVLAGFLEEQPCTFGIFSHIPESPGRDVYLEYLYTSPPFREKGYCGSLLKYAGDHFAGLGARSILSRGMVRPEHALEYHEFMKKRGFFPLNLTGRLLHYKLEDLLRPGAIQLILKNKAKLPPVADLEKAGERTVKRFLQETGRLGLSLERLGRYSRFCLNRGNVESAILASPVGEHTLHIFAVHLNATDQGIIFLELFSECADAASRDMGDGLELFFQVEDENNYQGMLRIFNPPDEFYLTPEYIANLGKGK